MPKTRNSTKEGCAEACEYLQHCPEEDDDANGAHLRELLACVFAAQLLNDRGPAAPVGVQVGGLQASLGRHHYVLPVGVSRGGPVYHLLPHSGGLPE